MTWVPVPYGAQRPAWLFVSGSTKCPCGAPLGPNGAWEHWQLGHWDVTYFAAPPREPALWETA